MATKEDVFQAVGATLELAQRLETEIGTALLALDALETGSFIQPDADAYFRLKAAVDGQTLGRAIGQIKSKLNIAGDLDTLLAQALDARNTLAHRFYPKYGLALLDSARRDAMVNHAKTLYATILPAYNAASRMSEQLVNSVLALHKARGGGG